MGARISAGIRNFTGCAFLIALSCLAAGAPAKAQTLNIGGTGAALGSIRVIADAFEEANPGVKINISKSIGSGGGLKAGIAGAFLAVPAPSARRRRRRGRCRYRQSLGPLLYRLTLARLAEQ